MTPRSRPAAVSEDRLHLHSLLPHVREDEVEVRQRLPVRDTTRMANGGMLNRAPLTENLLAE